MFEFDVDEWVEPIHAYSFFSVSRTGEIHEQLIYEYLDHTGYYQRVLSDDNLFQSEIMKLWDNMQYYLDQERVEINGKRVFSEVKHVEIAPKGISDVVGIIFIIDFAGEFVSGINKIETWLEQEQAPYDFEIIWRFPVGTKIREIETLLEYEITGEIIVLWAAEGQEVGGYERMVFELTKG